MFYFIRPKLNPVDGFVLIGLGTDCFQESLLLHSALSLLLSLHFAYVMQYVCVVYYKL